MSLLNTIQTLLQLIKGLLHEGEAFEKGQGGSWWSHDAPDFPFPLEPLNPSVKSGRSRGDMGWAVSIPRPLETCDGEEQGRSSWKQ